MLLCSNLLSLLFVMVSAVFTVGVCVCVVLFCVPSLLLPVMFVVVLLVVGLSSLHE